MLKNQPFLGISIAFAFGILGSELDSIAMYVGLPLAFGLGFIYFKSKAFRYSFSLLVVFVLLGFVIHSHSKKTPQKLPTNKRITVTLKPFEKRKSNHKSDQYFATIGEQRFLVYVPKGSPTKLSLAEENKVIGTVKDMHSPSNPYVFDYRRYLRRKGISQRLFVDSVLHAPAPTHWRIRLHNHIAKGLEKQGLNASALLFIQTMFLGKRDGLSSEEREQFQRAGVVHILAISGLHVGLLFGLIYWFLSLIFRRFSFRNIRIVIALLLIWGYIYFVGFRPSALRAGIMLTIYFTNDLLRQPRNALHSVFLAAFLLLAINPNHLFDLGFQLSFAAVLGLILFFPLVQERIPLRRKGLRYFRDLISSSCIAQFCTAPFVLYHFGFFSFWFLLGNLVLIPAAPILLLFSLCLSTIAGLGVEISLLSELFNVFSESIIRYIKFLSNFSLGFIENKRFTLLHTFLSIFFLVLVYRLLKKTKVQYMYFLLAILGLFAIENAIWKYRNQEKREFIFFESYEPTILIRERNEYLLVTNKHKNHERSRYFLNPFIRNEGGFIQERIHMNNKKIAIGFVDAKILIQNDTLKLLQDNDLQKEFVLKKRMAFQRISF